MTITHRYLLHWFLCLVLVVLVGPPPVRAQDEDAAGRFDRGFALIDEGALADAEAFFRGWLLAEPWQLIAAMGLVETGAHACPATESLLPLSELAPDVAADARQRLTTYAAGVGFNEEYRYPEAAESFAIAAAACLAVGDTLSAAVARYGESRAYMFAGDPAAMSARADQALALARGGSSFSRRLELIIRNEQAGAANQTGDLAVADSLFQAVLADAEAMGADTAVCDALNGLGANSSRRRESQKSVQYYRRALDTAQRTLDTRRECMILINLAYDETLNGQGNVARERLGRALELAETCDYEAVIGNIHNVFGAIAEAEGDRLEAIRRFTLAYQYHMKMKNEAGELAGRQRLAYSLMVNGDYVEASRHYERCLEILEHMDSLLILNWVYGGLALSNHKLGYLTEAEHYYRQAYDVNLQLDDRASAAWCVESQGLIHMLRGDYRQALVRLHEASALYEEIYGPNGIGRALLGMGEVYYQLGDLDQAFEYYEQVLQIAESYNFEGLLQEAARGRTTACIAAGRPELAEEHCRRALELARKWSDSHAVIALLSDLGEIAILTGRRDQAMLHLLEADSLLEPEGQYLLRSRIQQLLAQCVDTPEAAVDHMQRSLAAAVTGCLPEREWSSLSDLGVYQLAAGDTMAALQSQQAALEVVESLRRNVGVDELRRHMLRPALAPYEHTIDLLLASGREKDARAALAVTERSRAQILASRLRAARTGETAAALDSFAQRENELMSRIAYVQSHLQDASLTPEQRQAYRTQVDELEGAHAVLRLQVVDETSPAEAGLRVADTQDGGAADLWPEALAPGEQALSYFLGDGNSYVFHIHNGLVTAHCLPDRKVLEDKIQLYLRLRKLTRGPGEAADGGRPGDDRAVPPAAILATAGRKLYELLIGPVAADLAADKTLIIVPDGLLHHLPFAALPGPGGYLVEAHEISYVPSLATLAHMRARQRQRNEAPELELLAIGFGGLDRGQTADQRRINPFSDEPIGVLPNAAAEAWEVARLFDASLVLSGAAADERSVKSSPLASAEVVHIAAHGYAADRDVRRSFILLADSPADTATVTMAAAPPPEDGLLQWHEVTSLDLGASLVTLASCSSADGVLAVGEGITGLTQAFLYAGSTSVLAAQTDVQDSYARSFMLAFYQELRQGRTVSQALRNVQLAALAEARSTGQDIECLFWGDFVIVGDGAIRLAGSDPISPLGVVLAGATVMALIAVLVVLRRRRRERS